MSIDIKKQLKKAQNRSFLARDFESLRQQLIEQARIFFPDKIQDFSEASLGGLLVDMASYVGDSLSHYLDHEFRELDPMLAVETDNIVTHLRNAGVEGHGASPASVKIKITIEVPAEQAPIGYRPKLSCLPTILENTIVQSSSGISFTLVENLDFGELDIRKNLVAKYLVKEATSAGIPKLYTVYREVLAVSGHEKTQTASIANTHVPFREIVLTNKDVTDIISVTDSNFVSYYEVTALSQDTVFKKVKNTNIVDFNLVPSNLEIIPAPRRFVKRYDPITRRTTIRFGGGNADVLDDDILPDPSELSLELYGKKTFSRFSIDPNSLLNTQTLGIAPKNTTLTIRYRWGGGISHNVSTNTINSMIDLSIEFRGNPSASEALSVRKSVKVNNEAQAGGGANPPTIEDLRVLLTTARQKQSRVVTREDVLARLYTLPATFGRVYRAAIEPNNINPLSTIIYVASLDRENRLAVSPDALKKNLSLYLNEYRLIADAYDILDVKIINFGVKYSVVTAPESNKMQVIQTINTRIVQALNRKYFQIGQPIVIDDITNLIINTPAVIALSDLQVYPITDTVSGRSYSHTTFDFKNSTKRGILFCSRGAIFELRYPPNDVIGSAV